MSSEIYNDKRARQQLSNWGKSLIRFVAMQGILLGITTALMIFEDLNSVKIADFFYMAFMVGTIILFVRYVQYLIQLKHTSLATEDPFLRIIYQIELVSLFVGFGFNMLIMFVDTIYDSWLYTYLCSLPNLILSLVMALYFLKWTETFSSETVEPSTISEFKKGINLVILGAIIDFIPNINIIITYIGLISAILYVIGFWKIGKTIITEFGMGQLGDINLDATPDMYSGLGPSLYSPSRSTNSYDYGSGESSSEQKWDGQVYQSSSLCPYCGAPKEEMDAEFCATCGKKIR